MCQRDSKLGMKGEVMGTAVIAGELVRAKLGCMFGKYQADWFRENTGHKNNRKLVYIQTCIDMKLRNMVSLGKAVGRYWKLWAYPLEVKPSACEPLPARSFRDCHWYSPCEPGRAPGAKLPKVWMLLITGCPAVFVSETCPHWTSRNNSASFPPQHQFPCKYMLGEGVCLVNCHPPYLLWVFPTWGSVICPMTPQLLRI